MQVFFYGFGCGGCMVMVLVFCFFGIIGLLFVYGKFLLYGCGIGLIFLGVLR